MTTQNQIQLDANTIKVLERQSPLFMLNLLNEAEELRRYQDILQGLLDGVTEGLNPMDIDANEEAFFDYENELHSALWSIIHKKLRITDDMLKSIDD